MIESVRTQKQQTLVLLEEEYGFRYWYWYPNMSEDALIDWWLNLESVDPYFMTPEPLPGDVILVKDMDNWLSLSRNQKHFVAHIHCDDDSWLKLPSGQYLGHAGYGLNRSIKSLEKIISGGQTGADRAALDAGLDADFPIGGFCPPGRMAEDGAIDKKYQLQELPTGGYRQRTKKNVECSDGTVIFYETVLQSGSKLTEEFCVKAEKPYKLIDISRVNTNLATDLIKNFVHYNQTKVLNVAGPRQSGCASIYQFVKEVIYRLITSK